MVAPDGGGNWFWLAHWELVGIEDHEMSRTVEINARFEIPEERLLELLQYLRDYEQRDPKKIHWAMLANVPWLSSEEVLAILHRIDPPLPEEMFIPLRPHN